MAPSLRRPGEPGQHHTHVMRIAVEQLYPVTCGMGRPRGLLHPDERPGGFSCKAPLTFRAGQGNDETGPTMSIASLAMPKLAKHV
jgi:hypothetical protein